MTAHVQQASMLTGRSMTFMAVIGLHVVVISALMAMKVIPDVVNKVSDPLEWIRYPDTPDPSPPDIKPQKIDLPQTVMPVVPNPFPLPIRDDVADTPLQVQPMSQDQTHGTGPDLAPGDAGGTTISEPPARIVTALQYRITRPTEEYYPESSRMIQEQGVAIVRVCVDGKGRMSAAPVVETSSGSRRLDMAAVRWARESLSFKPATEDGVGVPACKGFRVNFNLN